MVGPNGADPLVFSPHIENSAFFLGGASAGLLDRDGDWARSIDGGSDGAAAAVVVVVVSVRSGVTFAGVDGSVSSSLIFISFAMLLSL